MTHTKTVGQKFTNLGFAIVEISKLVHVHVISFINDENTSRKSCCTKNKINFMYIAFNTCLQYIMNIHHELVLYMSHHMRKPTVCICENKGTDQLRGNCKADQRLCFRYTDSTILYFLNLKFPASNHLL